MDRYALVGWPLAFSLSAAIQRAAFAAAGVAAEYDLAPTAPADLPAVADRLRAGAWAGANITVPHKVAIRDLLDEESATALAVGAVNTVLWLSGGRLRGETTDVEGFEAALGAAAPEPGGGAIVLGAGG
ncbi:MAG: shikimate dehydrogenase family protein, partial [Anaerolineae bacterium]